MIACWFKLPHQTREKILQAAQYSLIAISLGLLLVSAPLMMFKKWLDLVPIFMIASAVLFTITWILHGWEDILIWYPNRWWEQ